MSPGRSAGRGPTPRRWHFVVLVVALALALAGCQVSLGGSTGATYNATVVEIVDGDTVDVRLANGTTERIRLLGVDTPEVHVETDPTEYPGVPDTAAGRRCLRSAGENATVFVGERIAGEEVRVEVDGSADRRGGYGRLLAYVTTT